MSSSDIIRDYIRQAFSEASLPLDPEFMLSNDILLEDIDGLDSVSRMRVIMSIEHVFSVEISPRENSRVKTIGDLIAVLQQKRQETIR
jgi:acyl carrier protein